MKKLFLIAALVFIASTAIVLYLGSSDSIEISHPWVKLAPPNSPMAGYLEISNGTDSTQKLVDASAEGFASVMIHRSFHEEGVAKMEHIDEVEINAGESVQFEPGGLHIMLMQPPRVFKVGDDISITLHFNDGSAMEVSFPVQESGEEHGSGHSH